MRRGIKKVEMVDAWTQTSNRGSDTEDNTTKKVDTKKEENKNKKELPPNLKPLQHKNHQRMHSYGSTFNAPAEASSIHQFVR